MRRSARSGPLPAERTALPVLLSPFLSRCRRRTRAALSLDRGTPLVSDCITRSREHVNLGEVAKRKRLFDAGGQRANPNEQLIPLEGAHRRDERRRSDAVAEILGREELLVLERADERVTEERGAREGLAPRSDSLARNAVAHGLQQILELALERILEVAHVPDEDEPPVAA